MFIAHQIVYMLNILQSMSYFFLDYLRIVFVPSLSDDQLYHVNVRYGVM